jgi:hypothetical protein
LQEGISVAPELLRQIRVLAGEGTHA